MIAAAMLIAREFAMRESRSAVLLPFGSLMGVIPTDSVQWGRDAQGDSNRRPSEIQRQLHSLIDPRPARAAQRVNAGGKKI